MKVKCAETKCIAGHNNFSAANLQELWVKNKLQTLLETNKSKPPSRTTSAKPISGACVTMKIVSDHSLQYDKTTKQRKN